LFVAPLSLNILNDLGAIKVLQLLLCECIAACFKLNFNKHVLEFFQLCLELVTSLTGEFATSHLHTILFSRTANSVNQIQRNNNIFTVSLTQKAA